MRSPPIGEAGKRWVAEFRIRKLGIRSGLTIQDPQDSGFAGGIGRIQDPRDSGSVGFGSTGFRSTGFRIHQDPGSKIRIQDSEFRIRDPDPGSGFRNRDPDLWIQDSDP